jgi:hypothetical protein
VLLAGAGRVWSSTGYSITLIRPTQDRLRNRHAERLRRLHVDDQLELGRLLDRQIGGLGALEDLLPGARVNIAREAPFGRRRLSPIAVRS